MIAVKTRGGRETVERLQRLRAAARHGILAPAMTESAQLLAERVKQRAPVKSGVLQGQIYVRESPIAERGLRVAQASPVGYVVVDIFYARFIEYGSAHQAAKPFVRPVIDGDSTEYTDAVARLVWRLTKWTLSAGGAVAWAAIPWQLRLAVQIEMALASAAARAITAQ